MLRAFLSSPGKAGVRFINFLYKVDIPMCMSWVVLFIQNSYYHIFTFFSLSLTTTDHGMFADGSVGSGSVVISFPRLIWECTFSGLLCGFLCLCLDWFCRCDVGIVLRIRRVSKRVMTEDCV